MALANFGEQFAARVQEKFFQSAVTPAVTNSLYEGDIQKYGDRVSILQFLSDIVMRDYVTGTDMTSQTITDHEDLLVVEKRKYYNFPLDRLEDLFTYGTNVDQALVDNAAKVLEKTVDTYVLEHAQWAKAGSWVGVNLRVTGSSADTEASIATTATGGTITFGVAPVTDEVATIENPIDGNTYSTGFYSPSALGKPIRLLSGTSWATSWYRITGVTNTSSITVTNWDTATTGEGDIPAGDILRGMYGDPDRFAGGASNGDGKPTTEAGWGWEVQAAAPTTMASGSIYDAIVDLAEALDFNEMPDTDRHLVLPSQGMALLRKASEIQPAIEMAYTGVVLNGRVARVAGFDVHVAVGSRMTTRAGQEGGSGLGSDHTTTTGTTGYLHPAHHISFITFANKWAETRVVDDQDQFAKMYQGLFLYGAKVTDLRRKSGALLFGSY